MKTSNTYTYFGLELRLQTNNQLFNSLFDQKYSIANVLPTQKLLSHSVTITFENKSVDDFTELPTADQNYLGDNAWQSKNGFRLLHHYLTTTTNVITEISSETKQLQTIRFEFADSSIFTLASLVTSGMLKRQLFQLLIKKYVEQALLGYLVTQTEVQCLHAAAIEKDGQAVVLAGLNGVGKSSLALHLIHEQGYRLLADNYVLIQDGQALKTPDSVRLKPDSIQQLGLQAGELFGFEKYRITDQNWSQLEAVPIKSIWLVERGTSWQLAPAEAGDIHGQIYQRQQLFGEDVLLSPLMNLIADKPVLTKLKPIKTDYGLLTLGNWSTIPKQLSL